MTATEGQPVVSVRPVDDENRRLWTLVQSLAEEFGPEREWSLIGGLMVQLHGFERDDDPRPSADIDVLGGGKRSPKMTERMATRLVELGARVADPPRSNPKLGYRFEYEGEIVELLGPDGLRADPPTVRGLKTFQVAGGSQALRRTAIVRVAIDGGDPVAVRRPDLLGAILIKARVLAKRREEKFLSDRQDLIRLLGYVEDPRALRIEMTRKEPDWLRRVEDELDFEDGSPAELFTASTLLRAHQAFRLLTT